MTSSHGSSVSVRLSDTTLTTMELFEEEPDNVKANNCCCPCLNQWWNSEFKHQRFIVHIVEKTSFHLAIIILVLLDCLLVVGELMLDFIYLSNKCDDKKHNLGNETEGNETLELAIEVLHFGSIAFLSVFVLEVLIKIYAFGKKWWDIHEKKMEWLDAIIVIVSFIIDVYFLKQPNVIAEISLLFISFRLWRIIRIINSVAQSVRSKDEQAKKNLTSSYVQVIELLLNVSAKKTNLTLELRQNLTTGNLDKIIEKFTSIDQSCRSILTDYITPTARHHFNDITSNLQEVLEQIRSSSSSTLTLTDQLKTD